MSTIEKSLRMDLKKKQFKTFALVPYLQLLIQKKNISCKITDMFKGYNICYASIIKLSRHRLPM